MVRFVSLHYILLATTVATSSLALPHSYLEFKDTSNAAAPARRSLEARANVVLTTVKNVVSTGASLAVKGAVAVKDDIVQKGKDAFTGAHIQAFLVQKHAEHVDNAATIAGAISPYAGPAAPALAAVSMAGEAISQVAQNLPQIPKPAIMKQPPQASKEQKPAQPAEKGEGQRPKVTKSKTI